MFVKLSQIELHQTLDQVKSHGGLHLNIESNRL